MIFDIPNRKKIEIKTIILDLNGTLAIKGKLVSGSAKKIRKLKKLGYKVVLFTGDQRGNANKLCKSLGIKYIKASKTGDKEKAILELDPETCATIGNGRIDIETFKHAKISILTLQNEGIHVDIIPFADLIVPSVVDALDLFIDKDSLIATMK